MRFTIRKVSNGYMLARENEVIKVFEQKADSWSEFDALKRLLEYVALAIGGLQKTVCVSISREEQSAQPLSETSEQG